MRAGRGLAGAARAAEQVGVRDAVLPNGVAKGPHHMVLPEHLVEPLGAIPAIQRLVTLHSADTTGRLATGGPATLGHAPAMSGGGRVLCNGSP